MDRLSVGMHVEIMRSDGRVHGALVTKLCHETGAVSVEWFEKGETKGKEVDLSAIMRNNPMLFQQPIVPSSPVVPMKAEPVLATRVARSIAPMTAAQRAAIARDAEASEKTVQFQNVKPRESNIMGNIQEGNVVGGGGNRASVRRSVILAPSGAMGPPQIPPPSNYANNNAENNVIEPTKRRATMAASRIPPSRTSRIGTTANENNTRLTDVRQHRDELSPTDETTGVISKSQVVSNVQEMEKNREQRRAQLVETKKLREVQKNIDPGNPNWQFLSMIRDYQAQVDYKPLKPSDAVKDSRICVCVRKRPINKKELTKREIEIITIPKKDHIIVHQPQVKVDLTKYLENQVFRFDYTFDENTTNDMVYKFTAQPLVRTIFQGGFATCFAYGQTGSGKTHTMGGIFDGKTQNCANGIYALTAMDVFKMLASNEYKNQKLSASCSFFEIYGAKVFDLLGKKAKLRVLEDGKKLVQVIGLKEFKVQTADDVLQLIKQGSDQRTAGTTSANSNSSRSHAVFQIILRKNDNLYGKFSLIDLAGNERGADTISSDRQTRLEGAEINKSLLALKECIRAMGRDVQHVPFRGSKLTLILRDSFVGKNAKTCMIAMISPGMSCVENTLNTLRYADRVKELGNENGASTSAPLSDGDFLVNTEAGDDANGVAVIDDDRECYDDGDAGQDLQMLHQRNSEFMNEEAYKYQVVLENMNKAEDAAVDQHQLFFDKLQKSVAVIADRLEETNRVEFDLEGYARNSIKDICDILNTASKCKASFECLLERIAEEQEFSRGK